MLQDQQVLIPNQLVGNTITWEIPSMAALQKTTISFKVSTDKSIYSNTLWRDDLETSGFTNWDYTIKRGNQLWFPTDGFGINNSVALTLKVLLILQISPLF